MKIKHYYLLLVFTAISWFACRPAQTESSNLLPGSLFKLSNITSSLFVVDSAVMNSYIVMDTLQKAQLLTPEVVIDNPVMKTINQTYINHFMVGRFIAKQDVVGDIQPVVISAHGDDYEALILLTLNKNGKMVSHLILSGGLDGGPDDEIGDSLIFYHDMQSSFQQDTIKTYILKVQQSEKDSTRLPIIDSISFTRKILPTGEIKLLKKDSTRYSRKVSSDWPKVCW